jgi:WD40 repeat protein
VPGSVLSLSRDGRALFAHAWNHPPLAWDVATGRALDAHPGHRGAVFAADTSPDGRFVITGGADLTARVWDAATGRELRVFERHTAPVHLVAFLADNRTAVSIDAGGAVKLWDAQTGEESRALALAIRLGEWLGLAVSPDRNLLAVGFEDRIRFWALPELAERDLIPVGLRKPGALRFMPDGRGLDFRSLYPEDRMPKAPDWAFFRWDLGAKRELLQVEMSPWVELASADGSTFVGFVGSWGDSRLAAWDRASGRVLARLGSTRQASARAFSPDGTRLLVSDVRDTHGWQTDLTLYDARTWRPVAAPAGHANMVHAATFSRDGRFLVTGSADGTAIVSDLATVPTD